MCVLVLIATTCETLINYEIRRKQEKKWGRVAVVVGSPLMDLIVPMVSPHITFGNLGGVD